MDNTIEKINKWLRDHYDIKIDYYTMTISVKKKD